MRMQVRLGRRDKRRESRKHLSSVNEIKSLKHRGRGSSAKSIATGMKIEGWPRNRTTEQYTRRRRQEPVSMNKSMLDKKFSLSDPRIFKVKLFQEANSLSWKNLSSSCCRGRVQSDPEITSSFKMDNDPLGAIIEHAKNAASTQRVPVVTFDLRKNQIIHTSSSSSLSPSPSHNNSSQRKFSPLKLINKQRHKMGKNVMVPCLRNTTTTSSSNVGGVVKSVLLEGTYLDDSERSIVDKETVEPIDNAGSNQNIGSDSPTDKHNIESTKLEAQIKHSIAQGKNLQKTFYYHLATQRYLQALSILDKNVQIYNDCHPLRVETVQLLEENHHAQKSMDYSANIVNMGLRHEARNEYMKALKMYSVAFRARKNMLGPKHPSLPIILNLLGSIQVKRKEPEEAMQIFELALYGKLRENGMKALTGENHENDSNPLPLNKYALPGTLAVSMKEIGEIYEEWGRLEEALDMYHDSLDYIVQHAKKDVHFVSKCAFKNDDECSISSEGTASTSPESLLDVCVVNATSSPSSPPCISRFPSEQQSPPEEMEIYLQESIEYDLDSITDRHRSISNLASYYDSFFRNPEIQPMLVDKKKVSLHVTTALHNIANVHRKQKDYVLSKASYNAALRGMKLIQGEKHPSVAAILGNLGNLLNDMKDYDHAFATYQTVLKIESVRLGFSHSDVMITMLNIALIELCRGNHQESINLYKEVIKIQRRMHEKGEDNANLLAVSYSCLGDAQEKHGDISSAIESYQEALTLRTTSLAQFHPDLGKLIHKLGRMCTLNGELDRADKVFTRALRLYKHNRLEPSDARVIDVQRDRADNRVKIALAARAQEEINKQRKCLCEM